MYMCPTYMYHPPSSVQNIHEPYRKPKDAQMLRNIRNAGTGSMNMNEKTLAPCDSIGRFADPIITRTDIAVPLWYDIIITRPVYYWSRVHPTLPPSLLPFFRSSSHPLSHVLCHDAYVSRLVRWGSKPSPLTTTHLSSLALLPLLVPTVLPPSPRRLPATLHPRPNYEDQYTRKLARAAPTLLVCRPSSSVDLLRLAGHPYGWRYRERQPPALTCILSIVLLFHRSLIK